MSLPNVNITLGNGNIGAVTLSDDGIAGLILTGTAVPSKLELNKVYVIASTSDLKKLELTEENNPLAYKEVLGFYESAGDGAELHLLVVDAAKTLTEICSMEAGSPLKTLIDSAAGRIRLVGINRNPEAEYEPVVTSGIDQDVVTAVTAAQQVVESYLKQICPVCCIASGPCLEWYDRQPVPTTGGQPGQRIRCDGIGWYLRGKQILLGCYRQGFGTSCHLCGEYFTGPCP